MFGSARRLRRTIAAADAARDRRDWAAAASFYEQALARRADRPSLWVQYGHALKERGDAAAAEAAYLRSLAIEPGNAETLLHLGDVRKRQGRPADAVDAFVAALELEPDMHAARDALVHMGAREALPGGGQGGLRRARELVALSSALDRTTAALAAWTAAAPRPVRDYDAFRHDYPPPPPPPSTGALPSFHLVIDAEGAIPAMLRATLLSLLDQRSAEWTCAIRAPAALSDHPVASMSLDPRIRFAIDGGAGEADDAMIILLDAGTRLDPEALAWFGYAAARTGAAALYADHDSTLPDWRDGATRFAPRLYPMPDAAFLTATAEPPLVVATRTIAGDHRGLRGETLRRATLLGAEGSVAHVPLVLSSGSVLPTAALGATDDLPARTPPAPPADGPSPRGAERLTVVIPTRDEATMLAACVTSLRARAVAPELLDIVVVDNRSVDPATLALLATWSADGTARVLRFDEPFNWSRANNVATAQSAGELLAFVNNDTEMLADGWDARVAGLLRHDRIGVVGARLLYPDRTIQHAGVLFGIGQGSPIHEGVGRPADDDGPLGRWRTRRRVPAVTGAFLATRRDVLASTGGFDVRLAIGFNDIDFCLRVRAGGGAIVYDPAIELIHHESKTRGINDSIAKVAWDLGELETFRGSWGDAMFDDPGYNPQWSPAGRPFDGYRQPSLRIVLDHIDRSATADPWALRPAREPEGGDRPRTGLPAG